MKKDNKQDLFSDKNLMKRVNLSSVRGGDNKSEALGGYSDTEYEGSYDTLINSILDVEWTTESMDRPGFLGDKVYPVSGK